jgi:hypothetical protein
MAKKEKDQRRFILALHQIESLQSITREQTNERGQGSESLRAGIKRVSQSDTLVNLLGGL